MDKQTLGYCKAVKETLTKDDREGGSSALLACYVPDGVVRGERILKNWKRNLRLEKNKMIKKQLLSCIGDLAKLLEEFKPQTST